MREIRRYSNRKLYDTERSHYATLADLATLVREGVEFRVVDRDSRRDLTSQTLAEIIHAEERRSPRVSIEVLIGVIKSGDNPNNPNKHDSESDKENS